MGLSTLQSHLSGSLIENGDEIVANGRLLDLIRRVRTFGISSLNW